MKEYWNNLTPGNRNLLKLIPLFLILLALPLTVWVVGQTQNTQQKAASVDQLEAEGGVLGGNATVITDTSASGGQSVRFLVSTPTPTTASTPISTPTSGTYAATYTATASTDQTAALKSFIEGNKGKRIALSGIIPVTSVVITLPAGAVTTIDFLLGAKIKGIATGVFGILRLVNSWDLVINDAHIEGTSYNWVSTQSSETQNEDGFLILGGGNITMNRPEVHDTRGDGIYVGVDGNLQTPPVAIVANDVKLYRNSRNGITPNAGQLTVTRGTIDQSGLHNIDMEPNHDIAAKSIRFIASNLRLTRHGNLIVNDPGGPPITGYAIAGLGYSDAQKQLIDIRNVSSDKFTISMDRADVAYFMNNSSDTQVTCNNTGPCPDTVFIYGMTSLTMSNNTNMIINTTYDIGGPR